MKSKQNRFRGKHKAPTQSRIHPLSLQDGGRHLVPHTFLQSSGKVSVKLCQAVFLLRSCVHRLQKHPRQPSPVLFPRMLASELLFMPGLSSPKNGTYDICSCQQILAYTCSRTQPRECDESLSPWEFKRAFLSHRQERELFMQAPRLSSHLGAILSLLGGALVIYGVFFLPLVIGNVRGSTEPTYESTVVNYYFPIAAVLLALPLLSVLFVLGTSAASFFENSRVE